MDKKKKISMRYLISLLFTILAWTQSTAQGFSTIKFCGAEPSYTSDSITLKFNLLDGNGKHVRNISTNDLYQYMQLYEGASKALAGEFFRASGGVRIPKETTISVLIDRGIDSEGRAQIFEAVRSLVNSSPDSCVYVSFFDGKATKSIMATANNFEDNFKKEFERTTSGDNFFYSALYSKLIEFNKDQVENNRIGYEFEHQISKRASKNREKNVMFVFVDGSRDADSYDPMGYLDLAEGVIKDLTVKPTIYSFYYTSSKNEPDSDVIETLMGITGNSKKMGFPKGEYVSTDNHAEILRKIGDAIEEQMYDYVYVYKASLESYTGRIRFIAKWNGKNIGEAEYEIGSVENPWPVRQDSMTDVFLKLCVALLVTIITIAIVFLLMKVLVPYIKSKIFAAKYYKKYEPELGVQKRICSYCKKPIEPGHMIVNKCKHIIHVACWKENDYRCAEYGQNCNVGIQEHVDWKYTFTRASIRDCHQALSGIIAGFAAWIVYELIGRGILASLASGIADLFIVEEPKRGLLLQACTSKVASFFAIGLVLGFFLSVVFRWNEEYRSKNVTIYMKIFALSLLSSMIGFLAFAFGGIILCMLVSSIDTTVIPWYCSLPAYILFSLCTSLSLTIKTSIPVKSAMLGGLCSAIVGFMVLYFTNGLIGSYPWMNMLIDFILYGGGLGASILTVRMLAEKYFLVIKNGVKAGTRIPIHKWMNATGGGNKVTIGMTGDCEIQMNWEKSNKVAKEHAVLYIDQARTLPVVKPLATNVIYNSRAELPVRKPAPLNNGDTIKIGDTIFVYEETD